MAENDKEQSLDSESIKRKNQGNTTVDSTPGSAEGEDDSSATTSNATVNQDPANHPEQNSKD